MNLFRSLMRKNRPVELSLRRDQGIWLLSAAALTLAVHLMTLPLWVSGFCAALLLWRGQRLWHGHVAPARWVLPPLAILAAIGIRLDLGQFLGKTPGVIFLALLLCLKLLESRNMRDIRVVVFLCFFLQFALFFSNQSLLATVLAVVALLLTLGACIALIDPASSSRERWRMGVVLVVQGAPFMVVLFLLFPRAIAPLWGIPTDNLAMTGLSDSMSPGTISEIILSDELAFSVEFTGPLPLPAERYWRGPVLARFDGRTWHMSSRPLEDRPVYQPAGRRLDYRIMLEPHQQRWLPVLDFPGGPVEGVRFSHDFQALATSPVNRRVQVGFSSFPTTEAGLEENPRVLNQARQLPAQGNPRARALAARLRADTPRQTVAQILDWMTQSRMTYTLQPPMIDENSIDFFLFESKMGFCEHFAGAFVFLARSAGLPARVVTGYQGGRLNPINGVFSVRQSDAHAWAEIWDGHWVRIDPTVLVAPQRIDRGLEASLDFGLPFMLRPEYSWLRQMRDRWEAVSVQWNKLVVAYDGNLQHHLLESVGLEEISSLRVLGAVAIITALLMGALYCWAQWRRADSRHDALDRAWARFSARLKPLGLARDAAEGPLDYARRLSAARPDDADTLNFICTLYARLRYRPPASSAEVHELAQSIHSLHLESR